MVVLLENFSNSSRIFLNGPRQSCYCISRMAEDLLLSVLLFVCCCKPEEMKLCFAGGQNAASSSGHPASR